MLSPQRTMLSVALVVIAAAASPAGADEHPSLSRARQEIDAVRFDRAHALLSEAHQGGGNDATALVEIHRLLGEVSVALGRDDEARHHFAALLALAPDATLGEMVSPKITAAFEGARSDLAGKSLEVTHEVDKKARAVTVQVKSDPLSAVAGVLVQYRDERGAEHEHAQEGTGTVSITLPDDARLGVSVFAVDQHGNRLRGFYVGDLNVAVQEPPPPEPVVAPPPPPAPEPPIVKRWWLWAGVAAGFATAGGIFTWRASVAQSRLDDVIDHSDQYFYSRAEALEDRIRSRSLWAGVTFGVAGAAAITSAILFATQRGGEASPGAPGTARLIPISGPDLLGTALEARF